MKAAEAHIRHQWWLRYKAAVVNLAKRVGWTEKDLTEYWADMYGPYAVPTDAELGETMQALSALRQYKKWQQKRKAA